MMKRLSAVLMALVLGSALIAGCSKNETSHSGNQPVTITYWKAPHSEREAELWEPIIAEFSAANPDIRVEHLVTPWETWTEKYTTAFAGGVPPDVSYMTEGFPQFADAGQLADLSAYVPANVKDMAGYSTANYKGSLIGISALTLASVLYYNTDIFNAVGLQPPKTWQELRETAKKLKTKDTWGFTPPLYGAYPHIIGQFIIQGGGKILNDAMTEMDFGTSDQQRGIQLLYDMVWNDLSIPKIDDYTGDEFGNLFVNGKSAMTIDQTQNAQEFRAKNPDLKFNITTVPVGPASDTRSAKANYGGIGFLSIAQKSKYKDQGWKFIEFLTMKGGMKPYLTSLGFFSGFADINAAMYAGDPYMEIAQAAASDMFVYPVTPRWHQIVPEIHLMTESVFRRAKTVSAAYQDCQKTVRELLVE